MNELIGFPQPGDLGKEYPVVTDILNVNGHLHTPFSFSAFENIEQIFSLAREENLKVAGINDFYVMDGYPDFYLQSRKNKVFPLYNIEFISLLKEFQESNIRVNDPNNPGRTYFSGKGLDFPTRAPEATLDKLNKLKQASLRQVREMIDKANQHLERVNAGFSLDFDEIKSKYARELVRERHIAKAIREKVFEAGPGRQERKETLSRVFSGTAPGSPLDNIPALENEIRGKLLKAGGAAYVEEDPEAFLPTGRVIEIIRDLGGIPCYPVLLDDKNGTYTDFEEDWDKMHDKLVSMQVGCIELIPNRNSFEELNKFVRFFEEKGFVISFGTEHNTPALVPLTVVCRDRELDGYLKEVNYKGACVIAAHQYYRARGMEGFIMANGQPKLDLKPEYIEIGNAVIQKFIQ